MSESVLLRIETRTFSDLQNRDLVIKWKKTLREVIMAKLYFKFGAMGSSKTAQALMTKFNYEEKGKSVLLIKPATDTRDETIDETGAVHTVRHKHT